MQNKELIDILNAEKTLSKEQWLQLICSFTDEDRQYAANLASAIAVERFGRKIFFRGIIEFTNICRNDCIYCGIRRSNNCVGRYRLTEEDILECCAEGYDLGYRTFVLQGGEDMWFTDDRMPKCVSSAGRPRERRWPSARKQPISRGRIISSISWKAAVTTASMVFAVLPLSWKKLFSMRRMRNG